MNTDGQGLARVTYQEWQRLSDDRSVWTYRGGAHGGPMFLAYVIGSETGGSSALPPPSLKSRDTLLMYGRRDAWVCHLCGGPVDKAARGRHQPSIDHLIPRVQGGSDYPSNLHIAHINCNKSRKALSLSTHAVCRESLMPGGVSLHIHAHNRKGDRREEIGERKGSSDVTYHSCRPVSDARGATATLVAPSPVTTPDGMVLR